MSIRTILVIILVALMSVSVASQKIDLNNEVEAKKILLGKSWTCLMVDTHGKGPGIWTFTSVEGDTVKGNIVIPQYKTCNSDVLKGKLKGNILKYRAAAMAQCISVNGILKFFHEDDVLKAEGTYIYGGQRVAGRYTCERNV